MEASNLRAGDKHAQLAVGSPRSDLASALRDNTILALLVREADALTADNRTLNDRNSEGMLADLNK